MTAEPCGDCGASGRWGTCAELFDALLALDHSRRQPWGRFHGLNVACYLLQHPSVAPPSAVDGQWQLVEAFVDGGMDAMTELQASRVRASRRSERPWDEAAAAPDRPDRPAVTIETVAVDGTFPADGYEECMRAWAGTATSPVTAVQPGYGTITGVVRGPDGAPTAGVRVVAMEEDTGPNYLGAEGTTDATGRYRIEALAGG